MTTSEDTYNGWKNHATWCVNLHLSNDEPLYREALARTADTIANPPHESEYWNAEETARYNVADMLKDWIEELCDAPLFRTRGGDWGEGANMDEPRLLVWDLVTGYLADVDWHEIADAWIESANEVAAMR